MISSSIAGIAGRSLAVLFAVTALSRADETAHKRPDPERFAKEIAKFDDEEKTSPPARGGIVFTGSSSIRLWDVKKDFPDLPVLNRGFGGSVANDLIVYADRVALRYEPKVLIVYEGGNDINAKLTPAEAFADEVKFIEMAHAKLPKTKVLVCSTKVAPIRTRQIDDVKKLNVLLEAWFKDKPWSVWVEGTAYLSDDYGKPREELYRKDRLHLNEVGYAKWKAILDPILRKAWADVNS